MKNYESLEACTICGKNGDGLVTYHHLKSRGAGGSDEENNLMSLCQAHHNEIHQKGLIHFEEKYKTVRKWLQNHSWVFCSTRLKWICDE